tara:strand:+ start:693 stop:938 length:246 start_codon:yes stop_codon:yes gene_type:complete
MNIKRICSFCKENVGKTSCDGFMQINDKMYHYLCVINSDEGYHNFCQRQLGIEKRILDKNVVLHTGTSVPNVKSYQYIIND